MTMKELKKYFDRRKPLGAIMLLILGMFLFFSGIRGGDGLLWAMAGAAMTAGGTYLSVKFLTNCSDNAVDAFCDSRAQAYFTTKKAIAESQGYGEAVYSSGFCFENIFSARKALRGKDKVWRSSVFESSCMFFTNDRCYYYSKKISLITDEKYEKQKDFRLQDIQMVSLEEMNHSVAVSIVIPGNEKLYMNCRNKEEAVELCGKLKKRT